MAQDLDSFSKRNNGRILIVCAHCCNTENGFEDKKDGGSYFFLCPYPDAENLFTDLPSCLTVPIF